MAGHLYVEEVARIRETFEMMDIGRRGERNMDELRDGLKRLGHQIPDADLQILVESVSIILSMHHWGFYFGYLLFRYISQCYMYFIAPDFEEI